MLLNCDLGESYGSWRIDGDEQVMPYIDQANIATGFHAGDPLTMQRTLELAKRHGVSVGAHPSYPDLVGFGRRSMALSEQELIANLHYQVAALDGMAASAGLQLAYVKPHGALYHDMMSKDALRATLMRGLAEYHRPLVLMLQATPKVEQHREEARAAGLELWFEAFADRCYDDDGSLLSRSNPQALHDGEQILRQVSQLSDTGTVTTIGGHRLPVLADTLCVHGDNEAAVRNIREIRALLS